MIFKLNKYLHGIYILGDAKTLQRQIICIHFYEGKPMHLTSSLSTVNQWTDSRASLTCIKSQIGKKAKPTVNQCCGRANIHK